MQRLGEQWLRSEGVNDFALVRIGFHAIPSMPQLHMHVTCQDALTPGMKNKKHWHSFTSGFLIPLSAAWADLEQHGRLLINPAAAEALLKQPLACHRCRQACKDMPTLRSHVEKCKHKPAL